MQKIKKQNLNSDILEELIQSANQNISYINHGNFERLLFTK